MTTGPVSVVPGELAEHFGELLLRPLGGLAVFLGATRFVAILSYGSECLGRSRRVELLMAVIAGSAL